MTNPTKTITVETLPVITHQDVRVITTDLLATLYGTKPTNISTNYLGNVDRFIAGKHFFKLEGDQLRDFKNLHKSSETALVEISPKTKHLTLWTERGAARHAKMLDTDQAWEVFEQLEDACFGPSPERPVDTLLPSEQQILKELVHHKIEHLSAEQQGKALPEIWSRVQRKLRVAKYSQIPRCQLTEAILYVTTMELRSVAASPHVPALERITSSQMHQISQQIGVTARYLHMASSAESALWARLRLDYAVEKSIANLPAQYFDQALDTLAALDRIVFAVRHAEIKAEQRALRQFIRGRGGFDARAFEAEFEAVFDAELAKMMEDRQQALPLRR